jgi:serine/threonine protein kinase
MIGNTLSHYKIIEKLGQGGMGEVYLAEDSRLDRKVALKILPQHLSERAELRERFEREARAVSSLNHPHICTLHDIGEQDGIHYLVMEHLEGETLAARLEKGALPLEQTLEYAIQIADALDKAHRQGVVHRDLKPGNIMLTKSGAKLLDFGLAKLQAAETPTNLSALPTEQANLTAEGTILGTLQYMAPEQLEGKEADGRTDIFAFGATVYEMATGKKAFEGKSQASLIAAIMGQDPRAMAELQPMTPTTLDHVVRRCLAKEPDKRWQTASDAMEELRWATEVGTPADSLPTVNAPILWKRALPWSIALLAVIVAGTVILTWTPSEPQLPSRLLITTPPTVPLENSPYNDLALSPDGRYLVFSANNRLHLRPIGKSQASPLDGTEGGVQPFFSPNSQSVAFFANGKLKKMPVLDGVPVTLCDAPGIVFSGSWGEEELIVFSAGALGDTKLYRVSANGGTPEILMSPDTDKGELGYVLPQLLPDGSGVLVTINRGPQSSPQLALVSLDTAERHIVLEDGSEGRYIPTGHLLYRQTDANTVMAVPFDLTQLEVGGDALSVIQEVRFTTPGPFDYTVSENGTLAYVSSQGNQEHSLLWVDRKGTESLLTKDRDNFTVPRISPDGMHIALNIQSESSRDVWIYDTQGGSFSRLTFEGGGTHFWSPDGKWIAFRGVMEGQTGIYRQLADRSATAELLTPAFPGGTPSSWSPDGRVIAFQSPRPNFNIGVLPIDTKEKPTLIASTSDHECCAVFSPDGKWLAYVTDEEGQLNVYVRPYPEFDIKFLISGEEGGTQPVWSPDGNELFYRSGHQMLAVPVSTDPSFTFGKPKVLFEGVYRTSGITPGFQYYDVSPDGQSFLMIKQEGEYEINVVLNWFEELKRLVPTN